MRRSDAFEAWVAPARARPELWRLLLGLALAATLWAAAVVAAGAAATGPRGALLGYLFAFAGLAAGAALAARLLHRRGVASLIGPRGFRPRGFLAGAAVVLAIAAATIGPGLALAGAERNQPLAAWLAWAPLALAAVLVQTSAEEIVFRGYLSQQLAARFRSPALWMGLPALGFGALHWNPAFAANAWAVAGVAALTGFVYADVTARLGDLSPAMGLHFANNAVALLVAGPAGPLGVFALWRAPIDPSDEAAMRAALVANAVVTLLAWSVWRTLRARRERALHSRGPGSI
jgi:hypothetical protein